MKSNNKIYSFFIALALLFWNPISYHLIYVNTPIFSAKINLIFYWLYSILFLVGILLIYLVQKNKFSEKNKKIIFSVVFTGILFSALVMLDSLVGLASNKGEVQGKYQEGLIFEPNSHARYQTVEFDYVANINSIGLRDKEITIEKGNRYRILCFGDSFTFGWGVDIENSWPKKLEQFLHEKGFNNIEVINCGRGGQYTTTYKKYMSKTVPLLKPDLVLVGVLQADDLAQLYINNPKIGFLASKSKIKIVLKIVLKRTKSIIKKYLNASFINFLSVIGEKNSKTIDIKSSWKASSNDMINGFNEFQKVRFRAYDDSVQNLFKSGDLNPGLLSFYINSHDITSVFNDPNNLATKFSIKEMDKDVKDMKAICQKYNCNLIFVNLPTAEFTGHKVIRTPFLDNLNPYLQNNNKIDSIYNSIATSNGLPYIQLTEYFLSLENKSKYFFLYDGHPNEKGYLEIANYIGELLIEKKLINSK